MGNDGRRVRDEPGDPFLVSGEAFRARGSLASSRLCYPLWRAVGRLH